MKRLTWVGERYTKEAKTKGQRDRQTETAKDRDGETDKLSKTQSYSDRLSHTQKDLGHIQSHSDMFRHFRQTKTYSDRQIHIQTDSDISRETKRKEKM